MKNLIVVFFALALISGKSTIAVADENPEVFNARGQGNHATRQRYDLGKDINLIASLKLGLDYVNFERNTGAGHENLLDDSDSFAAGGPAFLVTYQQKYHTGLSYLGGSSGGTNHNLDIWVGYNLYPQISVFLNYKYMQLNPDLGEIGGSGVNFNGGTEKWTFSGPMLGVDGNYPIKNTGFILFGTFGLAFLSSEIDADYQFSYDDSNDNHQVSSEGSGKHSENAFGPAIDLGVSYIMQRRPQLSFSGQMNYQGYASENDWEISSWGWIVAANYLF